MEWKFYLKESAAQTRRQESGIWIWNMDGSFCKRDVFQQIKFDNNLSFLLLSLNVDFWLIGMLSCLVLYILPVVRNLSINLWLSILRKPMQCLSSHSLPVTSLWEADSKTWRQIPRSSWNPETLARHIPHARDPFRGQRFRDPVDPIVTPAFSTTWPPPLLPLPSEDICICCKHEPGFIISPGGRLSPVERPGHLTAMCAWPKFHASCHSGGGALVHFLNMVSWWCILTKTVSSESKNVLQLHKRRNSAWNLWVTCPIVHGFHFMIPLIQFLGCPFSDTVTSRTKSNTI